MFTLEDSALPKVCLDVAGTRGTGLDFFFLLFPQYPLGQKVVGSCDVVVLVCLQGPVTQVHNKTIKLIRKVGLGYVILLLIME